MSKELNAKFLKVFTILLHDDALQCGGVSHSFSQIQLKRNQVRVTVVEADLA